MSDETTAIAPIETTAAVSDPIWSGDGFSHLQRVAKLFAASSLVPEHLRGNVPDVAIGLAMAHASGENPLLTLQQMYNIRGKAGWSATWYIARANRSGIFAGPISWVERGKGAALEVEAYAVLAAMGERVSYTVSMQTAKDEGWTKNPKYQTMPSLMLRYRSATILVRLYAPEILLGHTADELEDVAAASAPAPKRAPRAAQVDRAMTAIGLATEPEIIDAEITQAELDELQADIIKD